MDRLESMSAFVTVAELGGFAAAARRLRCSPATVTRLVASLEERLAIQLLARTTRSVRLTDGGARYLDRARRILADVDEAERAARAERSEPTGRLVVAAPSVFGRREVAPLVCEYLARYPSVSVELTLADRMVSLVDEGVDVAVRIANLEDSSLVIRKVGATRRVVVGSPDYLTTRKRLRTPADLAAHAIIQFTGISPGREWLFVRDGKEERVTVTPKLVTNSADAAVGLAERGGGLAAVLAYQVAEAVAAGRLEVVLARYEPPPTPIVLAFPTARLLSANVRAFVDLAASTRRWNFEDLPRRPQG